MSRKTVRLLPKTGNRMIALPVAPGEHLYLPGMSEDGPTAIKTVVQWVDAYINLRTGTNFTICVEAETLGGRIYEFSHRLIGKELFRTKEETIKDEERRSHDSQARAMGKGVY